MNMIVVIAILIVLLLIFIYFINRTDGEGFQNVRKGKIGVTINGLFYALYPGDRLDSTPVTFVRWHQRIIDSAPEYGPRFAWSNINNQFVNGFRNYKLVSYPSGGLFAESERSLLRGVKSTNWMIDDANNVLVFDVTKNAYMMLSATLRDGVVTPVIREVTAHSRVKFIDDLS